LRFFFLAAFFLVACFGVVFAAGPQDGSFAPGMISAGCGESHASRFGLAQMPVDSSHAA
jgi:hypothetical protein